ncbi:MAG: alpha/beta hydrolase [Desulfobacula sp.]|nr:alpha/beta hydrolase [Desulfobacula sp.]
MKKIIFILAVLILFAGTVFAEVLQVVPDSPDITRNYLFYLHGRIVEGSDGRPVSSDYGPYEYYKILKAFSKEGFIVISEIRPENSDAESYSKKVGSCIISLIKKGVPPKNISVVGASKGGNITARVSSALQQPDISYVILAGLFAGSESERGLKLSGRVLSVHDLSDRFPISPEDYFSRSPGIQAKKIIITKTGLGHGLLYRPHKKWFFEALLWIKQ